MIVVGVDGSPAGDLALETALELAREDEPLLVVTAWRELSGDFGLPYDRLLHPSSADIEREWAERISTEAAEAAKAAGHPADAAAPQGKASKALCALARERDARLIVVGSSGWGAVEGLVMGRLGGRPAVGAVCNRRRSPADWRSLRRDDRGRLMGTLSESELHLLDAYWRAATYLSVGQTYLFDNPAAQGPTETASACGTRRSNSERRSHRAYSVTPTIQGLNSSSPTPASSLLVGFPDATARSSSKISAPTCSTPAPSRIWPALTSMSGACAA